MSVRALLNNLAAAEEDETARLLAAVLNFDRLASALATGQTTYTPADVLRIGRVLAEYAPDTARGVADTSTFRPIPKVAGAAS